MITVLEWFLPPNPLRLEWVGQNGDTFAAFKRGGTPMVAAVVGIGPEGPPGESESDFDPGDLVAVFQSF
jgi:hypothetical protein